jgi:hypothetical protein
MAATLDLIESLAPLQVIPGHGAVFDEVDKALVSRVAASMGCSRNPVKHARHAIKVLMKFKLLECSLSVSRIGLPGCKIRPISEHSLAFLADVELDQLTDDILAELDCAGAAESRSVIRNI